jgi:hypothetical protein
MSPNPVPMAMSVTAEESAARVASHLVCVPPGAFSSIDRLVSTRNCRTGGKASVTEDVPEHPAMAPASVASTGVTGLVPIGAVLAGTIAPAPPPSGGDAGGLGCDCTARSLGPEQPVANTEVNADKAGSHHDVRLINSTSLTNVRLQRANARVRTVTLVSPNDAAARHYQ